VNNRLDVVDDQNNLECDSKNITIELNDSDVLSSTKNESSIIDISSEGEDSSVIIVENDVDRSKEEPNEKDDEDLADRNVEICSSSDEDETGDDAYVTSVQSPFQVSVNTDSETSLANNNSNTSADTSDVSQLLSVNNTRLDADSNNTTRATDGSFGDSVERVQQELDDEMWRHPKLSETDMLRESVNDELYNSILEKPGDGGGGGGGVEEVIDKVTNASLTLTVQEDSVVVDKIVDVIDEEDVEPEKDSLKGANGAVDQDVVAEEDRHNVTTSPNKRKAEEEPVEELNMSEVKAAVNNLEVLGCITDEGERTDVEDNELSSESDVMKIPSGLPHKRQRVEEPDLPKTVQVLTSEKSGAKVYLIGTAHFSRESCEDVAKVIQNVQPDIVMVELCKARTNMLHLDEETILEEAKNLNLEKSMAIIKQQGAVQGGMYIALLSMSAHLTRELGMAPGGEFRRAFSEAQKVPRCMVHLGDRPINITLKRALQALSTWQKIKLGYNILVTSMDKITPEEVEKCKERDLLENMLAEMAGEFPALSRVFVTERDLFLAHSLQMAADAFPVHGQLSPRVAEVGQGAAASVPGARPVIVGVVGIGHVPGIVKNWGAVTKEDVREVVRIEPPSRAQVVVRAAVKTLFWGGCLLGAYRLARIPLSRYLLVK